jgi:hypothetical protein
VSLDCPDDSEELIVGDEFLPSEGKCPKCGKVWEIDYETDGDGFTLWVTGEKEPKLSRTHPLPTS